MMNQASFHIVLVEPEIPANTGNIARLCAATRSVLHLVHPLGFRIDDAAVKRAGMDYWEHVDVREHPHLAEAIIGAPRAYFLTTKRGPPYWEAKFKPGDFFIFGRETKGLPEELLSRHSDYCLTIPMEHPQVRSLNLSTSVGIVLYEAIRQTSQKT